MIKTSENHISVIYEPIGMGFGPLGPLGLGLYFGPEKMYFGLLFEKRSWRRPKLIPSIRTVEFRLDELENVENPESGSLT